MPSRKGNECTIILLFNRKFNWHLGTRVELGVLGGYKKEAYEREINSIVEKRKYRSKSLENWRNRVKNLKLFLED